MNLIFAGLSRKPTAALHLSQPSMWVSVDLKEFDHHDSIYPPCRPYWPSGKHVLVADVAPVMLRGQEWVEHRDNPRFKVARRIRSYSCFQFHWSKETQLLSTKNLGELEEGFQPPWQGCLLQWCPGSCAQHSGQQHAPSSSCPLWPREKGWKQQCFQDQCVEVASP